MTLESLDIKQQKLRELQQIVPEIFEDGEIIPEKLRDIFGDEVNESAEHYSFTWSGKRDCYKTIRAKTNATLKVDADESVPAGDNVFIEGDNLEVLKLLQHAYHKKIKMIYITRRTTKTRTLSILTHGVTLSKTTSYRQTSSETRDTRLPRPTPQDADTATGST